MEKQRILVCDNKGVFLKMFKRKLKEEFEFFKTFLSSIKEQECKDFDHLLFIIYNEKEWVEYLRLDKEDIPISVCLFDRSLYSSLVYLYKIKNAILIDDSKIKETILSELKLRLKNDFDDIVPEQFLNVANLEVHY